MIDGFPLSFFVPLVVHALAALTTVVTGVITFTRPKRSERHPKWGVRYLWAYTMVFLTAIILSVQHWPQDAYLVVLATTGYGLALGGYVVRRYRNQPWLMRMLGDQWISAHIVGMIGSYVVLWTAFYVDNAHLIPLLKQLPTLTFWVVPTLIALPFLVVSLSRFAPKSARQTQLGSASIPRGGRNVMRPLVFAYDCSRQHAHGNGLLAGLLTILATALAYVQRSPGELLLLLSLASLLSLLHTFATTRAAPIMLSIKAAPDDDAILTAKLNQFTRWHTVRATCQVLAFFLLLWTLAIV